MDKIVVAGINIDCIVGVYGHERRKKQPLVIDLELYHDLTAASNSDNLEHGIDYEAITNKVCSYVSTSRFNLLETLAINIIKMLILDSPCTKVAVKIYKPQALKNGKVSIFMAKTRQEVLLNFSKLQTATT